MKIITEVSMLLRLGIIALITGAAFVLSLLRMQGLYWIAFAALVFSWMGDASLAGFEPVVKTFKPPQYWGMIFFAAAQICYAIAMALFLRRAPGSGRTGWIIAGYVVAGVALWWFLAGRGSANIPLKIATLVYSLCLVTMAGTACAAAFHQPRVIWPLFIGGLVFLASDSLIALAWFRDLRGGWIGIAIWATYVPAQVLLLAGFWMMPVIDSQWASLVG